jgi:hypothetical protein
MTHRFQKEYIDMRGFNVGISCLCNGAIWLPRLNALPFRAPYAEGNEDEALFVVEIGENHVRLLYNPDETMTLKGEKLCYSHAGELFIENEVSLEAQALSYSGMSSLSSGEDISERTLVTVELCESLRIFTKREVVRVDLSSEAIISRLYQLNCRLERYHEFRKSRPYSDLYVHCAWRRRYEEMQELIKALSGSLRQRFEEELGSEEPIARSVFAGCGLEYLSMPDDVVIASFECRVDPCDEHKTLTLSNFYGWDGECIKNPFYRGVRYLSDIACIDHKTALECFEYGESLGPGSEFLVPSNHCMTVKTAEKVEVAMLEYRRRLRIVAEALGCLALLNEPGGVLYFA